MQAIVAVLALAAVASAQVVVSGGAAFAPTVISRAPAFDSAHIKSDRLGGNFAYSVSEAHAYAAHTPIVQQVTRPVAVSYSAPAVQYAAAPVLQYAAAPVLQYAAAPAVRVAAAAPTIAYSAPAAYGYGYAAGAPVAAYGYGYAAGAPVAAYGYGYAAAPGLGYTTLLKK